MISLIVTTRNRLAELERLLESLAAQTYRSFEVIVVDQNRDDRLVELLAPYQGTLKLRRLRSGPGASCGRNAGLRAFEGEIVAFPDDDCWYPSELLAQVAKWFEANSEYDGLLTSARDENGQRMSPRFPPADGPCDKRNVMRCAIAWNFFLRAHAAREVGFFREEMGPGAASSYQSGEDLDYPMRALKSGFRLWHASGLAVHHPDINERRRPARVTYQYAMGVGRMWRLHGFSWAFTMGEIAFRSLGGATFRLCTGDWHACGRYLVRAAGQLHGYLKTPGRLAITAETPPMGDPGA
ncbi:MAG TPA: glycosyltransferase family A protein [Terriglobales bacterium]|nr:glycosyltransferase family A protein [Terriglobales bacterium]